MPKIIISYRRADSSAITGRIRDRLAQHYGEQSVFMDIDNIPLGIDFRKHIQEALRKNELLLAIVGPDWCGARATEGRARIHDETDPVRIEIETALQRGIPTIPVLVGGATMPKSEDLPAALKAFSFHNAAEVDDGRDFHPHVDRLIRSIDAILKRKPGRATGSRRSRSPLVAAVLAACVVLIAVTTFAFRNGDRGSAPSLAETRTENPGREPQAGEPPRGSSTSADLVNLLDPEQGARLLEAPDETWRKMTNGKEDDWVETRTGADAVYAFKDRKPATFSKFAVLIVGTNMFNPKDMEILAGDDWPTGAFRSVKTCTVVNKLLIETRYQECDLPQTTARFVKIGLVSSYHFNDWAHIPQIRLIGRLAP